MLLVKAPPEAPPSPATPRRRRRCCPTACCCPRPSVLGLVLGYPLVRLVVISSQDYGLRSLFTGTTSWAGLANYAAVLATTRARPGSGAQHRCSARRW